MKKLNLLFLFLILGVFGCKTTPRFYRGYVYHNNRPLFNVLVKADNPNFLEKTTTDSLGFFKLSKSPNSLVSLIFIKEKFKSDTIPSVWSQHGEKIKYTFLNKELDTIKMTKITLPNKVYN